MGKLAKPRRNWFRISVTCPECRQSYLEANYYPGSKPSTYGPADSYDPGDPPEIECGPQCPGCGEEIGEEHYDEMLEEAEEEGYDLP